MDTHTYTIYRYYGEKTEDGERYYEPMTHEGYDSEDEAWQAGIECALSHSERENKITVTNLEDGDSITWELKEQVWIITS
tara:strand:- start:28 stop:267 length:240 start_codon:yes stop_codon:yes gene_type:complete